MRNLIYLSILYTDCFSDERFFLVRKIKVKNPVVELDGDVRSKSIHTF